MPGVKPSDANPLKRRRQEARSDKRFCNDVCCQQHSYYTKVTPARLGKGSRKDRESGYDIDFYRDLTTTGANIGKQWET